MTPDEAKDLVAKHGGKIAAAAREAGMPDTTLRDRLRGVPPRPQRLLRPVRPMADAQTIRRTISEEDLLATTDVDTKLTLALRAALNALQPGEYMRDADMRRECHVGDLRPWRDIREGEEFWPYAMLVGHTSDPAIYWGRPQSVAGMIERGKARRPMWVKEAGSA